MALKQQLIDLIGIQGLVIIFQFLLAIIIICIGAKIKW